jgi:hypothetical protein
MKSKKNISMITMIMLLGVVLAGCGDDDSEADASFVGEWDVTRVEINNATGDDELYEGSPLEGWYQEYYQFADDGTGFCHDFSGYFPITWEKQSDGDMIVRYVDDGTMRWIYDDYTLDRCNWVNTDNRVGGGYKKTTYTRRSSDCD